jgi:branched-chain amino acid transport system ATP-binding protein
MSNGPPLLGVRGLRSGYATGDVVQGVSLHVQPGEIVGVLGRNGVGKTTLMRTLIGLLPARAGTILWRGQDVTRLSADARARAGMGYVPQGREVFPQMTVEENLRMGALINGGSRFDLDQVHRWFPILRDRARQRAGTLSGGQQEMLAIARALVASPDLLLLDEPSEGVQPSIVHEIGEFLRRLVTQRPIGVLLVEQNIDLMQTAAMRGYILDKGLVTAELTAADIADTDKVADHLAV